MKHILPPTRNIWEVNWSSYWIVQLKYGESLSENTVVMEFDLDFACDLHSMPYDLQFTELSPCYDA
jgi:hypothetical protein